MEKQKTKKWEIAKVALVMLLVFSFSGIASAEFWSCFDKGDTVHYCNDYKPDWTCGISSGCEKCMSVYREADDCYVHGSWNDCMSVEKVCSNLDLNQTADSNAPELTFNSPVEGALYDSRSVLLDFNLNEKADVYYYDNGDDRAKWIRVCQDCSAGVNSYSKFRSFSEGLNDLSFKAVDVVGNEDVFDLTFRIDSVDPTINRVEPRSGFAGSYFSVNYDEDNLKEVRLNYGNNELGFEEVVLPNCVSGEDVECSIEADLAPWDEMGIEYWFEVEDLAGNVDESKAVLVDVDMSAPEFEISYEIEGKYVYFEIPVVESNLDKVSYSYYDTRGRLRERTLCSKLKDGVCEKKVSFKDGQHDISIIVIDEAGHSVVKGASFFIDSKAPKIGKTYPRKGFASGDFVVEFDEINVDEVWFNYGNDFAGYRSEMVDLGGCAVEGSDYVCMISVDLADYNSREIEYWFNVSDGVGNVDESRGVDLDVDVVDPVLNNADSFWVQGEGRYARYVYFSLNVTEENLDEVSYSYIDYRGTLREKKLCSRLRDGICEVKKSFKDGDELLGIQIMDEAGNAVEYSINKAIEY